MDDEEREYYEELFEHRRQVEELYNKPIIGGKGFLVFLFLAGLYVYVVLRWF